MTDDLMKWLRAQLDEDEARANRGQWMASFVQGGRKGPDAKLAYSRAIAKAYLAGSGKPLTEGVTFQEAGLRVTDFCQRNG